MIRSDKKMAILITAIMVISAFALVTPASAALWQWEQVSEEGFGDLTNDYAWAMATYTPPGDTTEYLYVGTLNTNVSTPFNRTTDGCEVWRTNGTMSGGKYVWEQVVGPNGTQAQAGFSNVTGAPLPTRGTRGAVVYNDLLWFGTAGYAGIFVTNGTAWKRANLPFFGTGLGNATSVRSLVEYNGKLHVEAADNTNGVHIFRYNGSENFEDIGATWNRAKWEQVNDNGFDGTNYTSSAQLIEFNGDLYACGWGGGLGGGGSGLEIWRTNGTMAGGKYVWECVVGRTAPFYGPGWNSNNSASLSMVVFQNQLYVGTSDFEGLTAEIWRTSDGTTWECVVPNGFGRPNVYVWRLIEYQGKLIAGTMDPFLGCELWASDTGNLGSFEQINLNGMDLSYNLPANLGLLAKLAPYFGFDLPPIPEDLVVPFADQYGARTVAIYDGYLIVGTASWGDWVDKILYAVTGGNWTPLSDYVGCEIWRTDGTPYIPPEIEVNKTVWDSEKEEWVKELNASMGDTVRFKYELHNPEIYNLTNITVWDFLSFSLEYADDATRDPDAEVNLTMCDYTLGTMLVWDFGDLVLEPDGSTTIEYNASVVQCGADINFLFGEGEFNISKDTKEQSFGCDFAMVLVPCPSGDTTDSAANIKDVYYTSETVYATGSGFASNTLVDIYIVDDYAWFNGMNITDRTVYARKYNVSTDEYGNITAVEIWPNPIPGEYDMVFDANQNEIYDVGVDAVDHPNHPGFTVEGQVQVPALTPIGIAALVGVLSIIATSTILRRKRR